MQALKKKLFFSHHQLSQASKLLHLFIESHQQYSYWYLIYTGFYLFCTVNTLSVSFTRSHLHMNHFFYSKAISPQMEKEKEALAFSEIFN